jgi:YVTN family beta-propeller protein
MRKRLLGITVILLAIAGCDSSSTGSGGGVAPGPPGFVYVPNQADTTMYVFSSVDMSRVDSFDLPMDEPHFITFDHISQYYYIVGRKAPGQIAKYRASDDSLIAVVQVPGQMFPTACALSINNDTMYVTDFSLGNGRTHRYDVAGTNLVWADSILQAGIQTHDIRIGPNGRYVVSAGFSSDDITILDLQTGNVEPLTLDSARSGFNPVSNVYGPYGVLVDNNGTMAVIACSKGTDQLRLVDLVNRTILDSILIPVSGTSGNPGREGPTYMAMHPNNNMVFLTNYLDNTVSVVRLSTREVLQTLQFETPKPFGIAITADGSRVFVSCTATRGMGKGRVYVIDGNTYAKIDSVDVGEEPFGLAWRPL